MLPVKAPEGDETLQLPKHEGPKTFPNCFFFGRLVRLAYKKHLVAIRDVTYGYAASYSQFLTDVLHLRNILRQSLPAAIIEKCDNDGEVFVNLIGPCGYEFTVGFFALMALGAIIVPIAPDVPVHEALYFARKVNAVATLSTSRSSDAGKELKQAMIESGTPFFESINIAANLMQPPLEPDEFIISSDPYVNPNKAGYVIFTSGTTGPPKGCVMRRGAIYDIAATYSDLHDVNEGDTTLHVLPVHHLTGIGLSLTPFLWSGACVEFRSGVFSSDWIWERIRQGALDFFSGVPTMYMRLLQHYQTVLSKKDDRIRNEYLEGLQGIRALLCGSAALPHSLQQRWSELRGGRPILTRYGASEFGGIFHTVPSRRSPSGSAGQKFPGVDVKISEVDGQLLTKSALNFAGYVNDSLATAKAFDQDGYFKTGDIGRQDGEFYNVLGRISVDIFKSGGYKISAVDVEREVLSLDYISEAAVVGVEDEEYGQLVAVVAVLRKDVRDTLKIAELREDLRPLLTRYKLPRLLRVVGSIPKGSTGKINKRSLVKELFPERGHMDIQRWDSKSSRSRL